MAHSGCCICGIGQYLNTSYNKIKPSKHSKDKLGTRFGSNVNFVFSSTPPMWVLWLRCYMDIGRDIYKAVK